MPEECVECAEPVTRGNAFEVEKGLLCAACFVKRAQKTPSLSGQDKKRLRKAVKEELAGLIPRDAIRDLIEEGYRRILLGKEDLDDVSGRLVNEIERMAGLGMCRRLLEFMRGMTDAIQKGLEGEEAEVRKQIRRLGDLGTPG